MLDLATCPSPAGLFPPFYFTMNDLLPVYQHPSLTVLVDDSQSFLDSVAFRLNPQLAHTTFDDAISAVNWLHQGHYHSSASESIRVGYDEESDSFERRSASINLDLVCRTAMNRQRFNIPSILVVDYAMPQMNGVEFCEAIQDFPCKKILLTGQADEKVAIDAFNRKLIDRFIRKNEHDALPRLEANISALQNEFFNARTHTLKDLLSRHSYAFLTDPAIGLLVRQVRNRYRFVEHYLFPNPEGILFLDSHGAATLMVIATESSLTTQLEVAQDQGAPAELLAALQAFKLVAFFSDTGGTYRDEIGNDWLPYCLPPQICRGRESYYWALFELPRDYLQGPVYSYSEFLLDRQVADKD